MSSDFHLRFYQDEDLESLRQYFKTSTGKPFDEALWTWQYPDNYAGKSDPVAFICTDSKTGEFVGCIHSTPTIKRYMGEDYYCTTGSDAYVRPEYRGRGVYSLIANYKNSFESMLGSMRFSFYNAITKNSRTSSPILTETSVSMRIIHEEKVAKSVFGDSWKAKVAPYLHKVYPRKTKTNSNLTVGEGELDEFVDFYQGWSESSEVVHTPRTREYLEWRFVKNPHGESKFYSVWEKERLIGYFAVLLEDCFESYNLKTLVISDYLMLEDASNRFVGAVSEIMEKHRDVDIVVTRPFSSPQYQRRLMDMGYLDSMYFPLNQFIKPGAIGLRIFDEKCIDFHEKPWYLTHADCF